jgi:hypothetical protein
VLVLLQPSLVLLVYMLEEEGAVEIIVLVSQVLQVMVTGVKEAQAGEEMQETTVQEEGAVATMVRIG